MSIAQGTNVNVVAKKQSALGTPATGTGGTLINVRPSQGLGNQVATIESAILDRSGMKFRSRPGSRSSNAQYETEARVGNLDIIYAAVLGHTAAAQDLTEADLTNVAISGTGTTLTFGGGDIIALGLKAGMCVSFTGLATTGNNNRRVMITGITSSTVATISPAADGVLADETADTSFTMHVYKAFYTPDPRPVEYFTLEQKFTDLTVPASLLGTDMKANALNFGQQPNQPLTVGFGFAGIDLQPTGSYPNFNSETDGTVAGAQLLTMLDGGALYKNGVAFAGLTGLTAGLSANSSVTPLLTQRTGLDVGLAPFAFAGQLTAVLLDFTHIQDYFDETGFSLGAVFVQDQDPDGDFISVFAGDCVYGGANAPIAETDIIQTLPIYAGIDTRGEAAGYARSVLVISTSAP